MRRVLMSFVIAFAWAAPARADTLIIDSHQITSSTAQETTPTLGHDSTGSLVVYTVRASSISQGDIFYQRLLADGSADGAEVQVTFSATDDELNDVSGNFIVYTAYNSTTSSSGVIHLYDIASGATHTIGDADVIFEPRIHGDTVVWREGTAAGTVVKLYELGWLGTTQEAVTIAGPVPSTFDVDVGDRFVVWSARPNGQHDIRAYDLAMGVEITVAASPDHNERQPATSGAWVVYQAVSLTGSSVSIEAVNVDTSETRTLAAVSAATVRLPSIDGDLVAYEGNATGNFNVYVYRLSAGDTFAVTSAPGDQLLNDVHALQVAWVDTTAGDHNVYVASLTFEADPICAASGGDSDGDGVCDDADNCPAVANADQADTDGDGIGDACDDGGGGDCDGDDDDDDGDDDGDDDDDDGDGDDDDDCDDDDDDGDKCTVCHIPPGNPHAAHTIKVGCPAVPAHLAHGDFEGSCEAMGEDLTLALAAPPVCGAAPGSYAALAGLLLVGVARRRRQR